MLRWLDGCQDGPSKRQSAACGTTQGICTYLPTIARYHGQTPIIKAFLEKSAGDARRSVWPGPCGPHTRDILVNPECQMWWDLTTLLVCTLVDLIARYCPSSRPAACARTIAPVSRETGIHRNTSYPAASRTKVLYSSRGKWRTRLNH